MYSMLMLFASNFSSTLKSPPGSSGTSIASTSVILTVYPLSLSLAFASRGLSTIILKIPKSFVSARARALMFMPESEITFITSLILPI
jgi:hypothetical protein